MQKVIKIVSISKWFGDNRFSLPQNPYTNLPKNIVHFTFTRQLSPISTPLPVNIPRITTTKLFWHNYRSSGKYNEKWSCSMHFKVLFSFVQTQTETKTSWLDTIVFIWLITHLFCELYRYNLYSSWLYSRRGVKNNVNNRVSATKSAGPIL